MIKRIVLGVIAALLALAFLAEAALAKTDVPFKELPLIEQEYIWQIERKDCQRAGYAIDPKMVAFGQERLEAFKTTVPDRKIRELHWNRAGVRAARDLAERDPSDGSVETYCIFLALKTQGQMRDAANAEQNAGRLPGGL